MIQWLQNLLFMRKLEKKQLLRMKRALSEFAIEGVETTIGFHSKLMNHEVFVSGDFDTKFLEKYDVMNS